jgi:hypothetical protein
MRASFGSMKTVVNFVFIGCWNKWLNLKRYKLTDRTAIYFIEEGDRSGRAKNFRKEVLRFGALQERLHT